MTTDCRHKLWYFYADRNIYTCVGCDLEETPAVHQKRMLRKPEPVVERREDGLPVRRYQKEP